MALRPIALHPDMFALAPSDDSAAATADPTVARSGRLQVAMHPVGQFVACCWLCSNCPGSLLHRCG
jgi:hypothetical protein